MKPSRLLLFLCLIITSASSVVRAQVVNQTEVKVNKNRIIVRDTMMELSDTSDELDQSSVYIGTDGIRINDGGDKVIIDFASPDTPKDIRTRWILMDIGTDAISTADNYALSNGIDPFEINAWKSTNVNLHVFQQRINLADHKLHLKWGLTFEFHKYYFSNPVELLADQPQVTFVPLERPGLKKNRLSYSYLTLPLMFNYRLKPTTWKRPLNISAGGFAGPRLGGNFKIKDDDGKDKVRDDFNLAKWRYGLRGELGLGIVNFYGTLALNELFQEDKNNGFEVTPFSVGISIIPF